MTTPPIRFREEDRKKLYLYLSAGYGSVSVSQYYSCFSQLTRNHKVIIWLRSANKSAERHVCEKTVT